MVYLTNALIIVAWLAAGVYFTATGHLWFGGACLLGAAVVSMYIRKD